MQFPCSPIKAAIRWCRIAIFLAGYHASTVDFAGTFPSPIFEAILTTAGSFDQTSCRTLTHVEGTTLVHVATQHTGRGILWISVIPSVKKMVIIGHSRNHL